MQHYASAAIVSALLSVVSAGAAAQSAPDRPPGWTLGLAAAWNPSPYRRYDNKALPLPLVNYEGASFYFRGTTAGFRLADTRSDEFSIIVSPLANRFRHGDSDDPRLRRLSDREMSGMAGLAWQHRAQWGLVQASAQKEFTGHDGGTAFDLNYGYPLSKGGLALIPTLGVTYNSAAINNYYYGIARSEATRSGLPAYRAGGGGQPYFGIVATYRLSRAWIASGGVRFTALPSAVKDSPMVDADHTESYFLSLSYAFH